MAMHVTLRVTLNDGIEREVPGTLDTPDHIYRNLTDAYPAIDQADALVMQWVCNSAYDAGIMPTEIQSFTIKGELR